MPMKSKIRKKTTKKPALLLSASGTSGISLAFVSKSVNLTTKLLTWGLFATSSNSSLGQYSTLISS